MYFFLIFLGPYLFQETTKLLFIEKHPSLGAEANIALKPPPPYKSSLGSPMAFVYAYVYSSASSQGSQCSYN